MGGRAEGTPTQKGIALYQAKGTGTGFEGLHIFFIDSYVLFIIAYNYVKRGSIE